MTIDGNLARQIHDHGEENQRERIAIQYISTLFNGVNDGYIHIWTKNKNREHRAKFFPIHEIEKAAKYAVKMAVDHDVYIGMGTRKEDMGPHKRGGAKDINNITCIWLDIDFAGPAHSETRLPKNKEMAEEILKGLPPYSILVDSGHGLYVIWLFDAPFAITDEEARKEIQKLHKHFHRAADTLFRKEGYVIDNVSDLARILRLPGTFNYKQDPKLVTYNDSGLRYSTDDLLAAADQIISSNSEENESTKDYEVTTFPQNNSDAASIIERCPFMRHCFVDASILPESDWYYGLVSILSRTVNGRDWVHELSRPYPKYNALETNQKINHALNDAGPTTCAVIAEKCDPRFCQECRFKGHISSPIQLGTPNNLPDDRKAQAFPIESLPPVLQRYAEDAARAIGCPVDYIAVIMLAVAGGIVGSTHVIKVKKGWREIGNLYTALVAVPSSKKTPAFKAVISFLDEIVEDLNEQYKKEMAEYEIQLAEWEAAMDNWKLDKSQEKPIQPEKPILKRLYTTDTTVEALAFIMAQNPAGIAIYRDELSGWYNSLNSYRGGAGSDKEFFLSAYSGMPYIVDRKGKEPIVIPKTNLTIAGCMTPDVLNDLISKSSISDGFLDRILFVFPESWEHRWSDYTVPDTINTGAREYFKGLYALRGSNNPFEPVEIVLNDSENLFKAWYDATHIEMEEADFPKILLGSWGKLPGVCARIMLILHVSRMVTEDNVTNYISNETIMNAIAITEYFKDHYRKVYGTNEMSRENRMVEKVLTWAHNKDLKFITPRDIQTARVAGITKADEARDILNLMKELGLGIWSSSKRNLFILF